MHWNIMSTIISAIQPAFTLLLHLSLLSMLRLALSAAAGSALLVLFKPLLLGMFRAFILVLKPKLSKEERRARAQYAILWP